MKLTIAILSLVLALGTAVPLASVAEAKACKAKTLLDGKIKKWSCKAGEKCCFGPILGTTSCGKGFCF